MTLNNKLAFEVWVGIVVLVVVIGGVAGVTLMLDGNDAATLTRTQANVPSTPTTSPTAAPVVTPFISTDAIVGASAGIDALLGGASQ
jgi:hypothetical protein